jgi:Zn-dependent protease
MDLTFIFTLIVLIFSIVIHEVAHGYAANALGDPTARLQGRLTLNPISHVDPLGSILIPGLLILSNASIMFGWAKPVPYNPYNLRNQRWGEAMVAAAGPAVNLLIAISFGLLLRFGEGLPFMSPNFQELAGYVVYMNILLALFNLIPLPPLDGSKILKSLLPAYLAFSFERFEAALMRWGLVTVFVFLFIFMHFASPVFSEVLSTVFTAITGMSR